MGIKIFRPLTATQRYKTVADFDELTAKEPEKSLVVTIPKKAGRNTHGHITTRHRGGGAKRSFRVIDFRREKRDIPARVASIEYDPNRSARIALLAYKDGEKRYMLAPDSLKTGQTVTSGSGAEVSVGNAMPLSRIPEGMFIHNIELRPGRGAQMARSAGVYAEIVAKEGRFAQLRLPSGEIRMVSQDCYATIGQVSNIDHEKVVIGSAGRNRHLGWRPFVRGMCMNPVDHPNGGGEGRSKSGGGWHAMLSPWGGAIRGQKTRKRKKHSTKLILKGRKDK